MSVADERLAEGLWDAGQVAAFLTEKGLPVSRWWVEEKARQRALPSTTEGRKRRFVPAAVRAWLLERIHAAAQLPGGDSSKQTRGGR